MSRIRLILLDFDGTLVDTRCANARAYVETLREANLRDRNSSARHSTIPDRAVDGIDETGLTGCGGANRTLPPTLLRPRGTQPPAVGVLPAVPAQGGRVWIVSTGQRAPTSTT